MNMIQQYSTLSQELENLLICSLIVLDEESVGSLPDAIGPLKDICTKQIVSNRLKEAFAPVKGNLVDFP